MTAITNSDYLLIVMEYLWYKNCMIRKLIYQSYNCLKLTAGPSTRSTSGCGVLNDEQIMYK